MKDIKVLEIPQDLPVRSYGKLTNKQRINFWLYTMEVLWISVGSFIIGYYVGIGK